MPSQTSAASHETEVYRLISRSAAKRGERRAVIAAIAAHVLKLRGVTGIALELIDTPLEGERAYGDLSSPQASAVGDICYGSLQFGSVRIVFDPQAMGLSSPVKAAHFVGQQIASVLVDLQNARRYEQLSKQRDALAARLETRKIFLRAMAFLQSEHGLSVRQARRFLLSSTRKLRKPLLSTSRTIVSLESNVRPHVRMRDSRAEGRHSYARP